MAVTAAEQARPAGQQHRRLATVAPDGTRLREGIADRPSGVRFPETGGPAEAPSLPPSPGEHISTSFIRIYPRRIIACSIRPGRPGPPARDMPADEAGQ